VRRQRLRHAAPAGGEVGARLARLGDARQAVGHRLAGDQEDALVAVAEHAGTGTDAQFGVDHRMQRRWFGEAGLQRGFEGLDVFAFRADTMAHVIDQRDRDGDDVEGIRGIDSHSQEIVFGAVEIPRSRGVVDDRRCDCKRCLNVSLIAID